MGEFGGNAAFLSAWWDGDKKRWQMEVSNCRLGVQHIWWAIHLLDLVAVLALLLGLVAHLVHYIITPKDPKPVTPVSKPAANKDTTEALSEKLPKGQVEEET